MGIRNLGGLAVRNKAYAEKMPQSRPAPARKKQNNGRETG
jgi:hypothetical protein